MGQLSILIEDPVRQEQDGLMLLLPGGVTLRLMSGDQPVRAFNPGWRAESLFTLLDPLWLLVLRHEDGSYACWHIDHDGRMALAPELRLAAERRQSAMRMEQIALWLRLAVAAPIRLALPEAVQAYLALPPAIRPQLDRLLDAPVVVPAVGDAAANGPVPPLMFERIAGTRGYRIGQEDALVPLANGSVTAELLEGWQVEAIETVFAPMLTIVLRHADGTRALWFADLHGQVVATNPAGLPPALLQQVLHRAGILFGEMWDQVVLGLDGRRETPVQDLIGSVPLADLGSLAPAWMSAAGRDGPTRIWALDEDLPPGMGYLVPTAHGLRGFERATMTRAFLHSQRDEVDRLLLTGRMRWPSPADGSPVESDGFALLIDRDYFAYRFRQDEIGLVFYVICSGGHFRNYALYFPTAELVVMQTRGERGDFVWIDRIGETMLRHLTQFDAALAEGRARTVDPTVQLVYGACAIHIGHYVWQDLSGLAIMLDRNPRLDRLPMLQMFELGRTQQFFGPEERIFPVLDGRIERHAGRFAAAVEPFYRHGQRVVKYTAISVPASLRRAVLAAAESTPELQQTRAEVDAARRRGPVILLGIRVGNRTMADLDDFAAALVRHLGAAFAGCTVVLDGLNDVADRGQPGTHDPQDADEPPADSDLAHEFALARNLASIAAGTGVNFVDNINRSALRSVLWCSRADAFIAPLGAALAKYRWICNTPGMVLSSRWNIENRGDLHIYDSPAALEGSSEMHFNAVAHVEDAEAAPEPARTNFFIAREPVFIQFEEIVRRYFNQRSAG